MPSTVLFATRAYNYLAQLLLKESAGGLIEGGLEQREFPDGEYYHRIGSNIRGRHVWVLGGTIDDAATLELYDLARGCVNLGAFSLSIIIPYFGYSTMERAAKQGEIVKAKNRAALFSSVPQAPLGNRVVLIDLHADGIPYYFEGAVQPYHIRTTDLIAHTISEFQENKSAIVLASTDAGRAKWVEFLANYIGIAAAFVYKRRLSDIATEVLAINASVAGKHVVIYDDMIRTGSSLLSAARAYLGEGASKVSAITTHGLFIQDAMENIATSGLISKVVCFDTHPNAVTTTHRLLSVKSIAPLLINKLTYESAGD